MEFNLDKCVCMHVGTINRYFRYNIGLLTVNLTVIEKEEYVGVIINKNLSYLNIVLLHYVQRISDALKKSQ